MSARRASFLLGISFWALGTGVLAKETPIPQGWKSLFNGKDLSGWRVIGNGIWEVENGAIVSQEGEDKQYSWLVSDASYDNFAFHARFKWERGNSGIQFRSRQDGAMMMGYQADIQLDSDWITGHVYEQGGRGSIAKAPPGLVEELPKDDWIDYEIVCAGNHIQMFLNGIKTVDFHDDAAASGLLAFQVHSGNGCRVHWKDIRILELTAKQDCKPLFEGDDLDNGWRQVGKEEWSAKDGLLTGKSAKGGFGWLVTDREFQDFVVHFKYRWTGGNSGAQFRSWLEGEQMHGLQADIDPTVPGMTGSLWDEHERGSLAKASPEVDQDYDPKSWHSYEISAIGDDIRLYHDGMQTAHFKETDPKRIAKGLFALQLHDVPEGKKVHMEWKDLRILNLDPPSPWE